jgi:hypothetical protein
MTGSSEHGFVLSSSTRGVVVREFLDKVRDNKLLKTDFASLSS